VDERIYGRRLLTIPTVERVRAMLIDMDGSGRVSQRDAADLIRTLWDRVYDLERRDADQDATRA